MFFQLHVFFLKLVSICILTSLFIGCEIPTQPPVEGDRIFVCKEGESDFTSIQAAVNASTAGSTIEVCPGTYTENILLRNKALNLISREGSEKTIIEAAALGSTIAIRGVNAPGVTIEGFSIRGGNNANGRGGGIDCQASTVRLVNNAISNNNASGGGGVAANECSIEISGNRIFNNQARRRGGGALINASEGTIEENDIFTNKAQEGGGVAVVSVGFRTAVNSFSDTSNGESPTAEELSILISQASHRLSNSESIKSEISIGAFEPDGLVVRNNTIRENSAVPRRSIQYNIKESGGGGIWVGGNTPILDNVVQGNKSTINGGGIYVVNANTTITGNEIKNNQTGEDGAGLCINTCAGKITDNLFTENSSLDDAGGLRVYFGLKIDIENNIISKNDAVDASGGVKLSHSQNIFRNNTIEENHADTAGGLELDNDATIVDNCIFKGNTARLGAAIHSKAAERELIIQNTLFEENIAAEYGGALHFEHNAHPVILRGIKASKNQAKKGGFIATNNSRLELIDALLTDNSATEAGGALFLSGYEELLKDEAVSIPIDVTTNEEEPKLIRLRWVRMENNSAGKGGALFVRENTSLDAANMILGANNAGESGGGVSLMSADGLFSNMVIAHNTSPSAAGILLDETTDLTVQNCIITGNGTGEGVLVVGSSHGIWQYNNVYNNQGGNYSGIEPATGKNGNISQPPGFAISEEFDYYLNRTSRCLNAGVPEETFNDPDGSRSDMGAYGGPDGLWKQSERTEVIK